MQAQCRHEMNPHVCFTLNAGQQQTGHKLTNLHPDDLIETPLESSGMQNLIEKPAIKLTSGYKSA